MDRSSVQSRPSNHPRGKDLLLKRKGESAPRRESGVYTVRSYAGWRAVRAVCAGTLTTPFGCFTLLRISGVIGMNMQ
jgi:hypothetical protein